MSKYRAETYRYSQLSGVMKLPTYQRPLVWTSDQKARFIDNISNGFPFGSLLLYRYDAEDRFTLIDGQQRYTTLQEYSKHPERYFPLEDSRFIKMLMEVSGASEQPEAAQSDLEAQYIAAMKELIALVASGEQPPSSFLARKVIEIFPAAGHNTKIGMDVSDIQGDLVYALKEYIDLDALDVPCVVFTGDKADLPEVFANVNLGGRKLTKYQVFAAQWDRYKITLSESDLSSEVLDKTIKRYERLTSERGGLTIEDFSPEEMRNERIVTLPELCHALGEMILERSSAIWPSKSSKSDDTVDTIGYNSLAIVFAIPPKEIGKLPDLFASSGLENNGEALEKLLLAIIEEYRQVNARFAAYLKQPGTDDRYETGKSSSQLQFLSFFAALWRMHYEPIQSDQLRVIGGYKHKGYEATCSNLFPSFVHDMLTNLWRGSGDTRLGNYINGSLNYLKPISKEKLRAAMGSYLEELDTKESINIDPVTKTLLTIFANSHPTEFSSEKYDYEHLIPRDTLNKKCNGSPAYKEFKIPGGGLGNIAYLEAGFNRAKGSKTLFDSQNELLKADGHREEVDLNQLHIANLELLNGNPAYAKEFIAHRARVVADQVVDFVCKDRF